MSIAVSEPTAQGDSHPKSESVLGDPDAHGRNVLGDNAVDHHIDPGERVLELPFANVQEFEIHIHDSPDPFPCTNNSCDGLMDPRREDPAQPLRPTHVRFRSRVRITSGFRRYRRQSSLHHQTAIDHDLFTTSSSPESLLSSDSGSASSSISAPLRACGEPGKSGWGVLGQRIRFLPQNNSQKRGSRKGRRETKHIIANELSPLTLSPAHPSYLNAHTIEYDSLVHEDSRISQRIWPRRLPSNRWWWRHLHLIICCRSTEESDCLVE